jgi:heme oxygenase
MLSEKLKENTKTAHQELEKLLVKIIKSIHTTDEYLEILANFYQFYAPLEREILFRLGNELDDIAQRRKTEWIIEDLKYFHSSQHTVPPYQNIPIINDNLQALGALYVIEGSTLGGQFICKMISQKLEIPSSGGFSFFLAYGEDTPDMWENFKKFINGKNLLQEEEKKVMDAANMTFNLFKQSISRIKVVV